MLTSDDRLILASLEQQAFGLPVDGLYAFPYGINYAVLNNRKSRIKVNNSNGLYDDQHEQRNVRISQERIGQVYFISIRKVRG